MIVLYCVVFLLVHPIYNKIFDFIIFVKDYKKGWIVPLILPGSKLPNEQLVVVVCSYQIPSCFLSSGTWRG